MIDTVKAKRIVAASLGAVLTAGLGYYLLVVAPLQTSLPWWIITTIALFFLPMGAGIGWEIPDDDNDVAEVTIEGPIKRDHDPMAASLDADEYVDAIESANADALLVRLNTPGGEVVPSEDIRRAVEEFDGPTVGLAQDKCASGGYLIATACDHLVARDGGIVGSIGVIGSQMNASDLADDLGVSYEQYVAGKYKDAGHPLKDPSEDERQYIQSLIDTHYEGFVERVAEARDLTPSEVREIGAKVFLGRDAKAAGLVDTVGDEDTAREYLGQELDKPTDNLRTWEFEPPSSPFDAIASASSRIAYSFGAGLASRLTSADSAGDLTLKFR